MLHDLFFKKYYFLRLELKCNSLMEKFHLKEKQSPRRLHKFSQPLLPVRLKKEAYLYNSKTPYQLRGGNNLKCKQALRSRLRWKPCLISRDGFFKQRRPRRCNSFIGRTRKLPMFQYANDFSAELFSISGASFILRPSYTVLKFPN